MPSASGVKFHYLDHDSDWVDETPPVQNTWYEVFHAEDVRLIWCKVRQDNDETAAKDLEVRWTIDGNVYLESFSADHGASYHIYRIYEPSAGGTKGLKATTSERNAGGYVDKRGHDFKVEVRITSVPGTNERLQCWCVRETLELT